MHRTPLKQLDRPLQSDKQPIEVMGTRTALDFIAWRTKSVNEASGGRRFSGFVLTFLAIVGTSACSDLPSDMATAEDCRQLISPPPPPPGATMAPFWFSIPDAFLLSDGGHTGPPQGRIAARATEIWIAASSQPLRLDLEAMQLCKVQSLHTDGLRVIDVLAPADSQVVVALRGGTNRTRVIRVSHDSGHTWRDAHTPAAAMDDLSLPSALVDVPASHDLPHRMFATQAGPTLDVSINFGRDWTRVISDASCAAQGFTVDTAKQTLWYIGECALDRVSASWLALDGVLKSSWSRKPLETWNGNGVYVAEADPHDPHGVYLGGEGRLGFLTRVGEDVGVESRYSNSPSGESYPYILAIWPDPKTPRQIVFGGGEQGGGRASLLLSVDSGRNPASIPIEGEPLGAVRAIEYIQKLDSLMVGLERPDGAMDVHLLRLAQE
jgi:hypothetical protein